MRRYRITAHLSARDLDVLRDAVSEERFRLMSDENGVVLKGKQLAALSAGRQERIARCYDLGIMLQDCIVRVDDLD